jgi:non-ribosomal peptide synthetase component F
MKPASLETVLELSPMQHGVLFHALYAPQSSVYVNQSVMTLEGTIDPAAMGSAWTRLIGRHQALRCSLFWEGLPRPVQVVHRQVPFSIAQHDWRERAAPDLDAALAAFLRDDRRQPFDLRRPPQMRVALIRTGDAGWTMVWSRHHIQIDGWSQAQLLAELFWLYDAYRLAPDGAFDEAPYIGKAVPFERYITWLQSATPTDSAGFWRNHLRGIDCPTPMGLTRQAAGDPVQRETVRELSPRLALALDTLAQRTAVTAASVYQAAWAIVLAARADRPSVVFGSTVSGRPAEVPGIEQMVGLFINSLPIRADVDPAAEVVSLARQLQQQHLRLLPYQHTALAEIRRWTGGGTADALFDSVVVIGNYPTPFASGQTSSSLRVTSVRNHVENSLPVTLRVMPADITRVGILYDESRLGADAAAAMLDGVFRVLAAVTAAADVTVASCLSALRASALERRSVAVAADAGRLRTARRQPAAEPG